MNIDGSMVNGESEFGNFLFATTAVLLAADVYVVCLTAGGPAVLPAGVVLLRRVEPPGSRAGHRLLQCNRQSGGAAVQQTCAQDLLSKFFSRSRRSSALVMSSPPATVLQSPVVCILYADTY